MLHKRCVQCVRLKTDGGVFLPQDSRSTIYCGILKHRFAAYAKRTRVLHIHHGRNKLNARSFDRYTIDGRKKRERTRKIFTGNFPIQRRFCSARRDLRLSKTCVTGDRHFFLNAPAEISYYSGLEIAWGTSTVGRLPRVREISTRNLRHYIDRRAMYGDPFCK